MVIISFAELQCSAVCMWVAEVNGICSHRPIKSHWMFNFLITKSMILSDYFTWKKVKQKLTSLFKLFLNYSQSDFLITFFSRSDSQLKISLEKKTHCRTERLWCCLSVSRIRGYRPILTRITSLTVSFNKHSAISVAEWPVYIGLDDWSPICNCS